MRAAVPIAHAVRRLRSARSWTLNELAARIGGYELRAVANPLLSGSPNQTRARLRPRGSTAPSKGDIHFGAEHPWARLWLFRL